MTSDLITPDWSAPKNIKAFTTTVALGNMANHVPCDCRDVDSNRQYLTESQQIPTPITWLHQVHSDIVVRLPSEEQRPTADASFSDRRHAVCTVLTADCLPLLICQQDGKEVAAIHAGWRGLMGGVIDATIKTMDSSPAELLVWLGPAIGPQSLALGDDIRQDFLAVDSRYEQAFTQDEKGQWFGDMYHMARLCLGKYGVSQISGGEYDTYTDERFYSFRRQGDDSGRMASLIWMD